MRPVSSLAEYPRYEETQHLMKYAKQVSLKSRVNDMNSVSSPEIETDGKVKQNIFLKTTQSLQYNTHHKKIGWYGY